ncbi:MAG: hypothetical protein WBA59_00690 [Moheibacter sp.]
MNLSLKKESPVSSFLVLIPFFLIFGGTVFQNTDLSEISSKTKIISFFYMIVYVLVNRKIEINLFLMTILFLPFWIYSIFNNPYDINAAVSDGIRYMFPVVTLYYSYSIKEYFPLLLKFVVFFIIINFLVQLSNYFFWLKGAQDQWFYYTMPGGTRWANQTAGVIRATGTVVFFSLFGFINLVAFFLIQRHYNHRFKIILLLISVLGLFLSFSYKGIGAFAIILIFYYFKKLYKVVIYFGFAVALVYISFPKMINNFIEDSALRLSLYVTEGNSARSESYRVMFNEIKDGNWFGKGAGVFGGPASTEFKSPYYHEVNFNWYDTKWMGLTTTDTYPPHAFVELGTIGAIVYFFLLMIPLIRSNITNNYKMALIVYFCLMSDMLVSFSLNNLEYLFFSLIFIYPILFYKPENKLEIL